ncbi:MAG: CHAT domain-containing protein [Acidobacteria bacterium]|nr:CHAT domain-containing protein [Acidobacteriota bacterium]
MLQIGERVALRVWQQERATANKQRVSGRRQSIWPNWRHIGLRWKLAGAMAAVALLVAGGWWFFLYWLPVNKALNAMHLAWRSQRPGETRIVGFGYAQWLQTRGENDKALVVTDPQARERAGSILLSTVYEHPSVRARQALGRFYLADHKFDQAIEQFELVLKAEPKNAQTHGDLGAALLEKGKAALDSNQPEQSLIEAAKALEHLNQAWELDDSLLEALFNRALCFQMLKLPLPAKDDWQLYLKKDPNSLWAEEAKTYLKRLTEQQEKTSLGREQLYQQFLDAWRAKDTDAVWRIVSQNRNPTDGGIEDRLIEEYLDAAASRDTDKARITLEAFTDLGDLLNQRTGDRFTAELATYYKRANDRQRALSATARSLMKQAQVRFGKSEYGEAVRLLTEARTSFAQSGNECEALVADYRLGGTYVIKPDLKLGEQIFQKLSSTADLRSYQWLAFNALFMLATIKEGHNEFSQAVIYSQRSLGQADKLGDLAAIAQSLTQLADLHRSLNQPVNALSYLHRGLEMGQQFPLSDWHRWIISTATGISMNAIHLNVVALQYQKEELRIAEKLQRPLNVSRAYTHLGQTYGRLGEYAKAISMIKSAWDIGEKLEQEKNGNGIKAHAALQLGHFYRLTNNHPTAIEWYERSLHLYEQLGFPHYQYATRKGELLSRFAMADDAATARTLSEVLRLFDQYRGKISLESQRNNFFDQEQNVYDVAIDFEYTRRQSAARAFEYSDACRARSLLDLLHTDQPAVQQKYGIDLELLPAATPLKLADIQREMPDKVQLLQYAVLNDKVLIWLVTKTSMQTRAVKITNQELSTKIQRFRTLISKPDLNLLGELRLAGSDLYRFLIEPVETSLSPEKVVCIVPDKSLQYLSFPALVSPEGKFLLEKFTVMYAASSSAFIASTKSGKTRNFSAQERLLAIGNPEFDAERYSMERLPGAAKEVTKLAAFYLAPRVFVGPKANEKIARKEFSSAEIIHLATHYLIDEQSFMTSRLLLAANKSAAAGSESDGVLQNFEIYRLKWPQTKLVVLSACQTGIEQSFNGEGAFGAARPFIASGIPLVIASLWPVESNMTADLMIEFHRQRRLLKEPSVSALRQAQLSLLRGSQEQSRHPYFWASFSALGGYTEF